MENKKITHKGVRGTFVAKLYFRIVSESVLNQVLIISH